VASGRLAGVHPPVAVPTNRPRTAAGALPLLAAAVLAAAPTSARAATVADAPAAAARTLTAFPSPGAQWASTKTEISLRGVGAAALGRVVVRGSHSGAHGGRVLADSDDAGGSFVPDDDFDPGETVTVSTSLPVRGGHSGAFIFRTAAAAAFPTGRLPAPRGALLVQSFLSAPSLHPPVLTTVTANRAGSAPGLTFTAPYGFPGSAGAEISDDDGTVVYYAPSGQVVTNFRVQAYRGKPVLTWWQGDAALPGVGRGRFVIADTSYREIASFAAGNGLRGDLHEFTLTPAGTALVTAYAPVKVDTSSVGGTHAGVVLDSVIQELDVATGRVLLEWHALDHIGLADSYLTAPTGLSPWDYTHINSVTPYGDRALLVSLRSTHQVIEVDRATGAVTYLLGGKRQGLPSTGPAGTHSQHDAQPHDDGTITIFDNGAGAGPYPHEHSRGLVLSLDRGRLSVRKVLSAPPGLARAFSQGGLQALVHGGYLVDFGATGAVVEYRSDGQVLRDLRFQRGVQSYRATKAEWHAAPATVPATAVRPTDGGSTVYVSWNGATEVASWRLLAGGNPSALQPLSTVAKAGFETPISSTVTGGLVAVQALDAGGHVLAASAPAPVR